MRSIHALVLSAAAAGLLLAGCGGSQRTAPFHPVEGEFDPAASDAQALEIVDAMLATVGGTPSAFAEVKQIRWQQTFFLNDELRGLFHHSWDRWNARHRYEQPTLPSLALAEAHGDPDLVQKIVAQYRIFEDPSRAHVTFAGQKATDEDGLEVAVTARDALDHGSFLLAGLYRLKEPGTTLHYQGQSEPVGGHCEPACSIIMVRLAAELGGHNYFLHVNTESSRPELIARQVGTVQQAYAYAEWQEVAGIQFPAALDNVGAAERITFTDVEIGDVERALYVPVVRETGRRR
jgi:hypothetical protein